MAKVVRHRLIVNRNDKTYDSTYSNSDVGGWNKTNYSCQKENMKWYIHNWRCQIDEKVGQRWSYPQKKHVIQQLFPSLGNLSIQRFRLVWYQK